MTEAQKETQKPEAEEVKKAPAKKAIKKEETSDKGGFTVNKTKVTYN